MAKRRTPEQISADIAAARESVINNVQGLVAEVHPIGVKNRMVNDAKEQVAEQVEEAKGFVIDQNGPRWNRIGTAAFIAVGVTVGLLALRGLVKLATR